MSKLFNEFSPVSLAAWKEKIQTDLKGADYREKLISQTEGIEVDAVYNQENSLKTTLLTPQETGISINLLMALTHLKPTKQD